MEQIITIQQIKKKKKVKTINGLPKSLFHRLQFVSAFEECSIDLTMDSSILDSYEPRVLNSCSTPTRMPQDPLDVQAFKRAMRLPSEKPFFRQPELPQRLPTVSKARKVIVEPTYPSIIPLLMTAKFSGIDTRRYHVVSQRNVLRKLATNDEDFVVNVVRFNSTLYLRRFPDFRTRMKNDAGFRFEEMCTDKNKQQFDYNELIDGQIGEYKILMLGEVDSVREENGESIELKCKKRNVTSLEKVDWWLQAYLTGTKTIIHGRRARDDETTISNLEEYDTESMLDDRDKKMELFNRLHCALRFLYANVAPGRAYIIRGLKFDTQQRRMALYQVIDKIDETKLKFVTSELIDMFSVDNGN